MSCTIILMKAEKSLNLFSGSISFILLTSLTAPFPFVPFLLSLCACVYVCVCILGSREYRSQNCCFGSQLEEYGVRICLPVAFQGNTHRNGFSTSKISCHCYSDLYRDMWIVTAGLHCKRWKRGSACSEINPTPVFWPCCSLLN